MYICVCIFTLLLILYICTLREDDKRKMNDGQPEKKRWKQKEKPKANGGKRRY